jgi:hypothetical protein
MQIKGIGLPFPAEYSSCSNLAPKRFRWTGEEAPYHVYIDGDIERGLHTPNFSGKYGWLCESRDICDEMFKKIKANPSLYKSHFAGIFTCDREFLEDPFFIYAPPGSNLPWTKPHEMQIFSKSKRCSMIASPKDRTPGHRYRLEVAAELHSHLDLFGGAHGSPRIGEGVGPIGDWWRSKLPALQDYRFSIVFENSVYEKYYTEKITDCFATGTIPVYWGTKSVIEDFNRDGIIFWEDDFQGIESLSEDLYNSKIEAVRDNLERVKKLESADDIICKEILKR